MVLSVILDDNGFTDKLEFGVQNYNLQGHTNGNF